MEIWGIKMSNDYAKWVMVGISADETAWPQVVGSLGCRWAGQVSQKANRALCTAITIANLLKYYNPRVVCLMLIGPS